MEYGAMNYVEWGISWSRSLQSQFLIIFHSQTLLNKIRSVAFAFSIPVLAATLAFVTYTHVTPGFDVAVIFASLSLFQVS